MNRYAAAAAAPAPAEGSSLSVTVSRRRRAQHTHKNDDRRRMMASHASINMTNTDEAIGRLGILFYDHIYITAGVQVVSASNVYNNNNNNRYIYNNNNRYARV